MVASHKLCGLTVEQEVRRLIVPQRAFGTGPLHIFRRITLAFDDEPQRVFLVGDAVRQTLQSAHAHLRQVDAGACGRFLIGQQRIAAGSQVRLVGHNGEDELALRPDGKCVLDGDKVVGTFADMDVRLDKQSAVEVETLLQRDFADGLCLCSRHEAATLVVECAFSNETALHDGISSECAAGTEVHITLDGSGFECSFRYVGAAGVVQWNIGDEASLLTFPYTAAALDAACAAECDALSLHGHRIDDRRTHRRSHFAG